MRESKLLQQILKTQKELVKVSKEYNELELELATCEENMESINNTIQLLSNLILYPPNKGLPWKKRVIMLMNERRTEWTLLQELEDRWMYLSQIRMKDLQNDLNKLLVQEQQLYEKQLSADKRSQDSYV